MAAGRLLSVNSCERIVVDAYKLQDFKAPSKTELQWPFEVVDIGRRVYHQI